MLLLLSADSTSRVGAVCLLSANSTSGGERGGAVHFWLIQPAGWGCCLSAFGLFNQQGPLLADSTSWGGGGAVRFQPIQPVGGAHVCKLLLQGGGGGGGGGGVIQFRSGEGAHGTGCLR